MFIHFPSPMLSQIWSQLAQMIFENYSNGYYNDCVIIAPHKILNGLEYYKNLYPNSKMIAYQTEEIGRMFSDELLVRNLRNFDEVWDYDLDNIEILNRYGIQAKFKPYQYTNVLKTVQNRENPDIDVLFIGSPTKSRGDFFEDFNFRCVIPENEMDEYLNYKFVTAFQVYGEMKDELTSRAKIILTLPQFPNGVQPQARIATDLINNKCILSQKSKRNYYDDLIVEFNDANDCAAKIRYLIRDDNWRKFTNYSFKDYCDKKYKELNNA